MLKIDGALADKRGNSNTRKIVETYTLANNYRVKVTTWHDKERKAYRTSLSECVIETREGFTWERHTVFADYYSTIANVPVARYSWPNMERAHNIAAESCGDLVRQLLARGADMESVAA